MMNFNKPVAKVYAVILIIGLLLCGCSMIMWTLTPISNAICTARYWLQGLGMIIFSGGVFCRSYQLKKIHELVKSGRYQKSKRLDHMKLLITSMGIITFVEVIILLILQFSDPMESELHVTNEVIRIGEYHCENNLPYIWVSIQSGYLFCILLLGIFSMYSTWRISSSVDDTRINILMIFLCLVTLAVADVVWSYNGPDSVNKEDADSWWALSLITIWELCMMCSVFIPNPFPQETPGNASKVEEKANETAQAEKKEDEAEIKVNGAFSHLGKRMNFFLSTTAPKKKKKPI